MPQNKRQLFKKNRQLVSEKAQALCHPARLDIIKLLKKHGFMLCGEIADHIPLFQATVSQHLDMLLKTEIISREIDYGAVGYRLDEKGWKSAKNHLKQFFAEIG